MLVKTSAGYSRRVAVTSTWQPEGHSTEGGGVELGDAVVTTVVVPIDVVVKVTVERMVEVIVLAGSVVVRVSVVPGPTTVVVMTWPGRVVVERIVLTLVVVMTSVTEIVCVGPGVSIV